MWEDPIVAEVHRIREKLAAEHDFDIKAIFADLRKRQPLWATGLCGKSNGAEPTVEGERNGHLVDSASASPKTTPAE